MCSRAQFSSTQVVAFFAFLSDFRFYVKRSLKCCSSFFLLFVSFLSCSIRLCAEIVRDTCLAVQFIGKTEQKKEIFEFRQRKNLSIFLFFNFIICFGDFSHKIAAHSLRNADARKQEKKPRIFAWVRTKKKSWIGIVRKSVQFFWHPWQINQPL